MTTVPKREELREILRDLKQYNGLQLLAHVTTVAERTLYRLAEPGKRGMDPKTSSELGRVFSELGLLGGYDLPTLLDVIEGLRQRVEAEGSDEDVGAIPPGEE